MPLCIWSIEAELIWGAETRRPSVKKGLPIDSEPGTLPGFLSLSPYSRQKVFDATITAVATTTAFSIIMATHIPACHRLPFSDTISPSRPLRSSLCPYALVCLSGLASGTHIHGLDATHRNEPKQNRFYLFERVRR